MKSAEIGGAFAERVAAAVGTWRFVCLQSLFLAAWLVLNSASWSRGIAWDVAPFIILNLFLSCEAAYTGPVLLIAARRQEENQRRQLAYMLHLMEAVRDCIVDRRIAEGSDASDPAAHDCLDAPDPRHIVS